MKKKNKKAIRPMAATPPTTPPTMAPMGAGLLLLPELDPPGGAVVPLSREVVVVVDVDVDSDDDDDADRSVDVVEMPGGEANRVSTPLKTWHWKME